MDKYYTALYERTHNTDDIINAGWLEGKPEIETNLNYYTTPLDAIQQAGTNPVSVLLYPGCFAPVHQGHLTAMRFAKQTVEEQTGETVVAGYFTPDHDDYILRKTHDERFTSANRIALLHEAIKDEPWMSVENWASQYAPTDLNFTTLYDRFTQYIKHWLPESNVKVYLVFGGDNYLFANAFTESGYGVCIPRNGVQVATENIHPDALKRTLISSHMSTGHSSTEERKNFTSSLDLQGRSLLGQNYVLRNDLDAAFANNPTTYPNRLIADALKILFAAHTPATLNVETMSVSEQTEQVTTQNTISLDCFFKAEQNLNITRLFTASAGQHHATGYTSRPGTPPLTEQIKNIPQGNYTLTDDDIASGETMNFVRNLLETHKINVTEQTSLLQHLNENLFDIVDMRDFILGAQHGGLTVTTPSGEITRMLYTAPYVNLVSRAKIQPNLTRSLSIQIWKLNHSLYKGTKVTVNDIRKEQDFTLFGFSQDMTLEELCEKHIALLTNN